jgi:hypothetical protein
MRNQTYNGKTYLLVTYQWNNGESDAILIGKDFDTLDDAYNTMERIMPECMEADDGYDIDQWLEVMEKGEDDDIFLQFNAQIDDDHNLLAVLRPVK